VRREHHGKGEPLDRVPEMGAFVRAAEWESRHAVGGVGGVAHRRRRRWDDRIRQGLRDHVVRQMGNDLGPPGVRCSTRRRTSSAYPMKTESRSCQSSSLRSRRRVSRSSPD
jgi:hypothetical protein